MHIEPIIPDFEFVRIRRTGGILGVDQSLHIDRDLSAKVTDRHAGDRTFALDAVAAQELMASLSRAATSRPAASPRAGCDLFRYDIELGYGGRVYRVSSVDLGADEALHGVMLAANRLMQHDPDPFHVMTLHTRPGAEPVAAGRA